MSRKKVGIICITVVLIWVFASIGIFFQKWNQHRILTENLQLGEQYLLEEDYEAAIVAFTKVIETDPKCVEGYTGLADIYLLLGDYDKALEIIEKGQAETGNTEVFASYFERIGNRTENTELSDLPEEKIETLLKFLYYEEIGNGYAYDLKNMPIEERAWLTALCMSDDVFDLCTDRMEMPELSEDGIPAAPEENVNRFLEDCTGTDLAGYLYDGSAPLIKEGEMMAFGGGEWGTAYPFARIEEVNAVDSNHILLNGTVGWEGESEETGYRFEVTEERTFEALLERTASAYLDGYTIISFQYNSEEIENEDEDGSMESHETAEPEGISEENLRNIFTEYTGGDPVLFYCDDYDGNGTYEAFALSGSVDNEYEDVYEGNLYFVDQQGIQELLEWDAYVQGTESIMNFGTEKYFVIGKYFATGNLSYIWGVKDKTVFQPELSGKGMSVRQTGENTLTVICDTYDGEYDETGDMYLGHTWKPYYLYWDGDFKEYGGISITEEQLMACRGGQDILDQIHALGGEITDIFWRQNGIININYNIGPKRENATLLREGDRVRLQRAYGEGEIEDIRDSSFEGSYVEAFIPTIATYPERF
ncbi:MAG: tetratricopeptide repeat protein [Lachnospiraceae bacterium]|nr:tetratricopeptide repeat protein [Lachnospiraceae bacterium]